MTEGALLPAAAGGPRALGRASAVAADVTGARSGASRALFTVKARGAAFWFSLPSWWMDGADATVVVEGSNGCWDGDE